MNGIRDSRLRDARERGFSLLEMAVVLVVMGLLTVALGKVIPLIRSGDDTQTPEEQLAQADKAILGFVLRNHRLPCPAANHGNGRESWNASSGCTNPVGELPFQTLGVHFPQRFRYGAYQGSGKELTIAKIRHTPLLPRITTAETEWPLHSDGHYEGDSSYSGDNATFDASGMSTLTNVHLVRKAPDLGHAQNTQERVNGLDFCAALRDAQTAPVPAVLRSNDITMAYVIAHPGALDANGDGDFFDGSNTTTSFEAPGKPLSNTYDDRVLATGFAELAGRLSCPAFLSRANASAHTARAAYDNFLFALAMLQFRAYDLDVATYNLQQSFASAAYAVTNAVNGLLGFSTVGIEIATANAATKAFFAGAAAGLAVVSSAVSITKAVFAIQKIEGRMESFEKAKDERVKSEKYAHTMLVVADGSAERALEIDEKGLLP